MAKISFNKLGAKMNQECQTFIFNEQVIEVKQYLPVNNKLELISNVINGSDDNNFANPVKVKVLTLLEILYAYTNINFTEKQKEDPAKLYDLVISSGLADEVIAHIPDSEYQYVTCGIEESVKSVYSYRNSLLGIFETITTNYSDLNLEAGEIQQKLADPNNMALLKDILTKLG